jgi:hypothetical protein
VEPEPGWSEGCETQLSSQELRFCMSEAVFLRRPSSLDLVVMALDFETASSTKSVACQPTKTK